MMIRGFRSLLGLRPQSLLGLLYHLPNFFRLFWRLLKDPRVGLGPKLILFLIAAYIIMPADILPDFLLALGQMDDILVVFLGLKGFIRLCPREIVAEHVKAIAAGR